MSKEHNYYATFIAVAEDCPNATGEVPPVRVGKRSAANVHFEMAVEQAGTFTQEQILFATHLNAKGLDPAAHPEGGETWDAFYSKGQPCLRASALGKRYGWGVHFDAEGRVTAVAAGGDEYDRFAADADLAHTRAMRSRRA